MTDSAPPSVTSHDPFSVDGSVVWITGSSRGIGAGIARQLAGAGATVVVHGRHTDSATPIANELANDGRTVLAVEGDIRDVERVEAIVATITNTFGRLDGVVANVGGAGFGSADDVDPGRFARQLELNLVGSYTVLRACHGLLAASRGSAVMVSAIAATNPTPMFAGYGAAKAGIEQLARTLAAEWGPAVRVNAVSPGVIRTDGSLAAVFQGSEELVTRAGTTTAVGRIGNPSDVAYACQYLLSRAAGFVSGSTLVVDGGPVDGPTQRVLKAIEDEQP